MRKKKNLTDQVQREIESKLFALYEALRTKHQEDAKLLSAELTSLEKKHLTRSAFESALDFVKSIVFALVIATIIRQMWFENYTIPTGSMRPTLKEGDFLIVSKDSFAINVPLMPKHFYFDYDDVKRGGITIFSTDNMEVQDPYTMYFYIFPGRKQLVKRLIAKPGDTLYFYGGKIYGYDKEGKDLEILRNSPWFDQIEHIPFMYFDGKVETPLVSHDGISPTTLVYQMNEPVAKLSVDLSGKIQGKMLYPPNNKKQIKNYYDLWGFRNYAMARILDKEEINEITNQKVPAAAPLYLELRHHPAMDPARMVRDPYNRLRPDFFLSTSIIPLYGRHLSNIMNHMTTARFIIQDGFAYRYGSQKNKRYAPEFKGVPDGTYEFDNGTLYKIGFAKVPKEMPKDHPLYEMSYERVKLLFNQGIEFNTHFNPNHKNQHFHPSRYAYFNDGNLFLMSNSIFSEEDQTLVNYIQREQEKTFPERPFIDEGAPLKKDGSLDREFIKTYGLKIPENGYLMLGDNHAMSGDSRMFGFVPGENLKGTAGFIYWPPSSRWGWAFQPSVPWISFPNIVIWLIFFATILIWTYYHNNKWGSPPKF